MEMVTDGAMAGGDQGLEDLMSRKPIDHKREPAEGRILKLLVYGDRQMRESQIKIGAVR